MTKVFTALATSADGYITGPDPSPEQALGTGGGRLFDWYFDGDQPSRQFDGFRLSEPSREVFDGSRGPRRRHPRRPDDLRPLRRLGRPGTASDGTAVRALASAPARAAGRRPAGVREHGHRGRHRPASQAAGDLDVALMGSGMISAALRAGLLDEITVHQVPILLGGGTPLFAALPAAVELDVARVVAAPGVTHLTFAVRR